MKKLFALFPWLMAAAGLLVLTMTGSQARAGEVLPGVEVMVRDYADKLAGRRVGLLTNPTGVDRRLRPTAQLIQQMPGVQLKILFAPEHGLYGGGRAGEQIENTTDPLTGLPVMSLYGSRKAPPAETLAQLDVLLYDIQDVGHRTYTFISSMARTMEACEQAGVELWVLDRPDPMGGNVVGGPILQPELFSFIGVHPIPPVYGLTPGEFARLYQREKVPGLKLTVVPMQGWKRGMTYGELGWPWVPPSEHIPRWESSYFYAMTGIMGELGKVSEGVGTPLPFELVAAPWITPEFRTRLASKVAGQGITLRWMHCVPRYGTHAGKECQGVQIYLTDPRRCNPWEVARAILQTLAELYPEQHLFDPQKTEAYRMYVKALGDADLALWGTEASAQAERRMQGPLDNYMKRRQAVLLYE